MRPTEILSQEHRVIELVLAALERMADRTLDERAIPVADAHDAVAFLRTFADACHHGKEEARLFPAMEARGLPREAGPTAVMRHEHELGRAHVRAMDAAVAAFEKGDQGATLRFAAEAREFVDLLRDHIAKEDQVLFPMADRMLPASEHERLLADFRRFEEHDMAAGTHERFLGVAQALAARYGVSAEAAKACAHSCGCSHAE